MRFLDASTFLYAILKPAQQPPPEITENKRRAQAIITRIQEGEPVTTTIVHISETANILESRTTQGDARNIIQDILDTSNITITPVDRSQYEAAVKQAENHNVGINDALAYFLLVSLPFHLAVSAVIAGGLIGGATLIKTWRGRGWSRAPCLGS